jgi:xylan 1,4-beta-xylosidase
VTQAAESAARIAWFAQAGSQTPRTHPAPDVRLSAPAGLAVRGGRGQVTIDWRPVDRAVGYLVHRADSAAGPLAGIDHHGGDVLAVPAPPYADTTGERDRDYWYSVAALASIDGPVGDLAAPARGRAEAANGRAVTVAVDAGRVVRPLPRPWRPVIGSEHLGLLLREAGPGGSNVGIELAEALRIVRRELGVRAVRAHAILDDTLRVYREVRGRAIHDFGLVDAAYERLLATGLTPIVELSFMPRDLALDPESTVFDYRGIISPPRDLAAWSDLVGSLAAHLAARHGIDAAAGWPFEVWNEANLRVFWTGDQGDYFDLYDAAARAIKAVDPRLQVGGPSTAAVGWVDDLLAHAADSGVAVDFLSTHTYGAPPLDLRPIAARFGRPDLPLLWTEWGVSPTHSAPVNDSPWGAPLVCRGLRAAAGRVDALAYWVASDHFVELGDAPRLFHGGFGLLTIGNLRKPRFWAIAVLERLGADELESVVEGDGSGGLVEAWASRDADGRVAVALWNGTLDQARAGGDPVLDRSIRFSVEGLPAGERRLLRHWRVDAEHANIRRAWEALGGPDWPDERGWDALRAADRLAELEPARRLEVGPGGRVDLEFELPMPAVSLVELVVER